MGKKRERAGRGRGEDERGEKMKEREEDVVEWAKRMRIEPFYKIFSNKTRILLLFYFIYLFSL